MIRTPITIGKGKLATILILMAFLLPVLGGENRELNEITGKVVGVHDGDSITVLTDSKEQVKVRLHGIDAPELGQPFGKNAKQELSQQVFGKIIRVVVIDKDRYGRTVGDVYIDNRWVNLEMVAYGMAWHYLQYSKSPELAKAQESAKAKKLGLWADKNPIPPWEYRRPKNTEPPPTEEHPMPLIKLGW